MMKFLIVIFVSRKIQRKVDILSIITFLVWEYEQMIRSMLEFSHWKRATVYNLLENVINKDLLLINDKQENLEFLLMMNFKNSCSSQCFFILNI